MAQATVVDLVEDDTQNKTFENPHLHFGLQALMSKSEMIQALNGQLRLHCRNLVNGTSSEHPNLLDDCYGSQLYESHRLAVVGWLVGYFYNEISNDHKPLCILPTVRVMDRYVTALYLLGESHSQIMSNIESIRAACLALAHKMYSVGTDTCLEDIQEQNDWKHAAIPEPVRLQGPSLYRASSVSRIAKEEVRILVTLKGNIFAEHDQDTIFVLGYLLLDCAASLPHRSVKIDYGLNQRVAEAATKYLWRTLLNVRLLQYMRWKFIAVCCLLGVVEVCELTPPETSILQDFLISLFEKCTAGDFTLVTLHEIKRLLPPNCYCVTCCSPYMDPEVRGHLLPVSSLFCSVCNKRWERIKNS